MKLTKSFDSRPKLRLDLSVVATALGGVLLMASPATAGVISFVDMFRAGFATQIGDGNSLSSAAFRMDTRLNSVGVDDFSLVELSINGGAAITLAQTGPTVYTFVSPTFASQTDMDTAFPFGTYAYTATGTPSDATSFDFLSSFYPSQPFLAGSDFSALQGMNPAAPFTFHFSPFAVDGGVTEQFIFFSIFDLVASTTVYSDGFLPRTTTEITIPAGTLLPEQPYLFSLTYSNRLFTPSPGAEFSAVLGFDLSVGGRFETGLAQVPEPGSLVLLTSGAGWALMRRLRRGRSRAA